jgi:formate transporter
MDEKKPINPAFPSMDALLPPEIALKAEGIGVAKAHQPLGQTFLLSILAGAFIAMGAIFATTVTAGASGMLSFGVTKFLGGLVFSLGLILVVVGGAELFTGNNLIVMAWASHRISMFQVLRNWVYVYIGNFVGSIATAFLMFFTKQYTFGGGVIGLNVLGIANSKTGLDFIQAVALGILCNALVCMAVWMCYSARSTSDKVLAIIFPITAFVAAGFEHSVANMYFIPIGLFVKQWAPASFWEMIGKTGADYANLTWSNFLVVNLLPVTIGNIIGGAIIVGLLYWCIYVHDRAQS